MLQSFLVALANPERDGRIIFSVKKLPIPAAALNAPKTDKNPAPNTLVTMRYLLLNPAEVFREVVEEARSIIFAGGTMTPVRALPSLDWRLMTENLQPMSS